MLRLSTTMVLLILVLTGCVRDPIGTGEPDDVAFMKIKDVIAENLRKMAELYDRKTRDLAFEDDLLVEATDLGMRIVDVSRARRPQVLTEIPMTGVTGGVSVHSDFAHVSTVNGIRVFDISDPLAPILKNFFANSCGSARHTLVARENASNAYTISAPVSTASICDGVYMLAEFFLADLSVATVANRPLPRSTGCHTFGAQAREELVVALCDIGPSGGPEAEVWDMTDPANPLVLSNRLPPSGQSWHSAMYSWDGDRVALGTSTGLVQVFAAPDISAPPLGSFQIPMRGAGGQACDGGFTPGAADPHYLVLGCQSNGTSVLSISNVPGGAVSITEEAWAVPAPPDQADTWASYWYNGPIFESDVNRGLRIFSMSGPGIGSYPRTTTPRSNPRVTG